MTNVSTVVDSVHVNELIFEGDDNWTKQFNKCSLLYQEWMCNGKEEVFEEWVKERLKLELGYY